MARKELTVVIDTQGRDHDKAFLIKEMPASQAEAWAMRALMALAKSGAEIPDNVAHAGIAGVAAIGLQAFAGLTFENAEPLLGEMMACVRIIPDPTHPNVSRPLVEDDIEEVMTRLKLRAHVFELHTGFSLAADRSPSTAPAATQSHSSSTKTSRAR